MESSIPVTSVSGELDPQVAFGCVIEGTDRNGVASPTVCQHFFAKSIKYIIQFNIITNDKRCLFKGRNDLEIPLLQDTLLSHYLFPPQA